MNYGKRIARLSNELAKIQRELDILLEMDSPPGDRVERVKAAHAEVGTELEDLDRIMKNRMFQEHGIDYYKEFERQLAEELRQDGLEP